VESLLNFSSIFLDSFSGLMPFFLFGLITSALVEVFIDFKIIQKFSQNWLLTSLILGLTAFVLPVAKGGVLPLAHRLYQKGIPLYQVLFLLTAAPLVNFLTFENTAVAFGWGNLVWLRFGMGWCLALLTGFVFSRVTVEAPITVNHDVNSNEVGSNWPRFIHAVLSDCFEWLPFFIGGSLLAAVLRTAMPMAEWMNAAAGAPAQIAIAMLYGAVLSISSVVDSFVVLNWLGRFPMAAILAFLMAGGIVDVRGLVMVIKGFGVRTSLYWSGWVLVMIFIGAMVIFLGFKG
jgi:uncharacterized protein